MVEASSKELVCNPITHPRNRLKLHLLIYLNLLIREISPGKIQHALSKAVILFPVLRLDND